MNITGAFASNINLDLHQRKYDCITYKYVMNIRKILLLLEDHEVVAEVGCERSPSRIVNDCVRSFGMSPKFINNGWCYGFASRLARRLGSGAEVVDTTGLSGTFPGHSVVRFEGKYYDAETPRGVVDPAELDYSKRLYRSMETSEHDRRPPLRKWPESVTPAELLRILTAQGIALNGIQKQYLAGFHFYTLCRLPIACLNLRQGSSERDRVIDYQGRKTAAPPIVFDEGEETIIDGLHRAIAADRAGQTHVLAYVAAPEDAV